MFLFADQFLKLMVSFRVLWLAGRFGGGKTLLSFALSAWLYNNGYADRIYSNIPSPLCSDLDDTTKLWKSAMVLDEAWVLLDAREYSKNVSRTIGAFLRKYDLYLLLPSVFPVDVRFRSFYVQRTFNGMILGLPLWVYSWRLNSGVSSDRGWFGLWMPQKFYGSYDTMATPSDDGGLLGAMQYTVGFDVADIESEYTGDAGMEIEQYEQDRRNREAQRAAGRRRLLGFV